MTCSSRRCVFVSATASSISPDNPDRDIVDKRMDYAEAGILEYWIVNPMDETVTVLVLAGGEYREHGVFRPGQHADSLRLSGFSVNVRETFDAASPHHRDSRSP